MPNIPNPASATFSKFTTGSSDTTISDGVFKFMGCSVASINMSLGFNGTASSLSLTLVEDKMAGDTFTEPRVPSLHAFSLPKGGIGTPIIYTTGISLDPQDLAASNVPFYFCGICTNWSRVERDTGGKTISVSLTDIRELLPGVQCLLSGFALSQNIGTGTPRYTDVHNVIDVFGYFNYGYESERNEYGMPWSKIREVLNAIRVKVFDINIEFWLNGEALTHPPAWYRLEDDTIDVLGLIQKVCQDGGSDLIVVARKADTNTAIVEFRAIRRTNSDPLFKTEIINFANARGDIVKSVNIGKEFRNEPDSSVVLGGMKNTNYVAFPSEYLEEMHLTTLNKEDYNAFPADIKVRLFGGQAEMLVAASDGSVTTTNTQTFSVNSGAIFPFWGFTPDDHAYPLIEPFLPLDHLVFDAISTFYAKLQERIPLCQLSVRSFSVRNVPHTRVFLPDDEDPDNRPFAYLDNYVIQEVNEPGKIRGLPLNTEVLRAALLSEDCFYTLYRLYYSDIADALFMPKPKWSILQDMVDDQISRGETPNIDDIDITQFLYETSSLQDVKKEIHQNVGEDGKISKDNAHWSVLEVNARLEIALSKFRNLIYQLVKQYALDVMGKKFLVVLPASNIMQRIWANLPVPTRPEKPEIEYVIDQRGYWEYIPGEFDGIVNGSEAEPGSPEDQIRRKFMGEDGRFLAMTIMDWLPLGNINFNANGINKAMFQDLPVSEFRPNRIANSNPTFVCISSNVSQLPKRPDLALVELPSCIHFDPTDSSRSIKDYQEGLADDEFLATKASIIKYLWYFVQRDDDCRTLLRTIANANLSTFTPVASRLVTRWADTIYKFYGNQYRLSGNTEAVMDLKAVIIPLTSTWVAYGPWYANYDVNKGMVRIEVDPSLVPWNFERPPSNQNWDTNLNIAGEEKLSRSLADLEYVDTATIAVAGFPEFGPAAQFGYNSNITSISVDFNLGGVVTTYSLATYNARPGTYRKSDYDNVSRARIDTREQLPDIINENLFYLLPSYDGTNRFAN
jgi:hypothetical protein